MSLDSARWTHQSESTGHETGRHSCQCRLYQKIFKQHRIPRLARRSAEQRSPRVIPADCTKLDLRERTFDTEYAGLFLFAFDLAQMDLKTMLDQFTILRE